MGKKILLFLYFIVWIFVVLIFWLFTDAADAMGYITYMLAEYATFQIYNSLYFGKINLPRFEMIVAGGVVSILGLAVGRIFCRYKRKAGGDK